MKKFHLSNLQSIGVACRYVINVRRSEKWNAWGNGRKHAAELLHGHHGAVSWAPWGISDCEHWNILIYVSPELKTEGIVLVGSADNSVHFVLITLLMNRRKTNATQHPGFSHTWHCRLNFTSVLLHLQLRSWAGHFFPEPNLKRPNVSLLL